jgi:type I restriction enzyme S subunit
MFFQKAIHRLRPNTGEIEPGYMLRFMRFAAERGLFTDLSSQTSIAHLTQEKLALLKVPTPPKVEQQKIASVFEKVNSRINSERSNCYKLQFFKKALMEDLLTGKVRVTPLLEEEPNP